MTFFNDIHDTVGFLYGTYSRRFRFTLRYNEAPNVGDRVQTTAAAAKGKELAIQCYRANAKVKTYSGEIIASEGTGRGRK